MLYFDSAATTMQKPGSVVRSVVRSMRTMTTPGRGDHPASRLAAEMMYALRKTAAEMFDVSGPENVILTSNATHGLNIAIRTLVSPGDTVVISGYEHNAVTRPLHAIGGVTIRTVKGSLFDPAEMVEGFERALDGSVSAVICSHMSNVFGYVLPVEEIAAAASRRGIPVIVDASQSAGILPLSVRKWNASFVAMPGHKGLYGPQGTGLLLCGEEVLPIPLLQGGTGSVSRQQDMPEHLPDRSEAGTQNVHGAAGLLAGLRFVAGFAPGRVYRQEKILMERLAEGLLRNGKYHVFMPPEGTSVLSVVPEMMSPEELAHRLGEKGVAVRAGLHCAPLAHSTAGTEETGTVRFSPSVFNTAAEVDLLLKMMP